MSTTCLSYTQLKWGLTPSEDPQRRTHKNRSETKQHKQNQRQSSSGPPQVIWSSAAARLSFALQYKTDMNTSPWLEEGAKATTLHTGQAVPDN